MRRTPADILLALALVGMGLEGAPAWAQEPPAAPTADESAVDGPAADEPSADGPAADGPAADGPARASRRTACPGLVTKKRKPADSVGGIFRLWATVHLYLVVKHGLRTS